MKLPSKTICQLSALSRALTDPQADDFEAMDTHDMLMLVVEIAEAHAKLEEDEFEANSIICSINDIAFEMLEDNDVLNRSKHFANEIFESIHEGRKA